MYNRILVPFDGSETARAAIPYAQLLAQGLGSKIDILTVAPSRAALLRELNAARMTEGDDIGGSYLPYATSDELDRAELWARERAQATADEAATSLRGSGLTAAAQVVGGDPADSILAAAEEAADTLTVIATHGRSGVRRWALGSVTDKVVRHSSRPVLVVRAGHEQDVSINAIVLPLDGSHLAEYALEPVQELARTLALPVHLVRSISLAGIGYGFIEDGPTQFTDLAGNTERIAREYLQFIADRLREGGISDVQTSLADSSPEDAIIDEVGPEGRKLVVMASHGRSGLNRWVLGSVADRVVRHGPGPVMLVPPGQ